MLMVLVFLGTVHVAFAVAVFPARSLAMALIV